ncbi:MAG TPA: GNAT family N-acetyltransferase [Solirubrobacterales bacterium]|nr:GNAT family N-acetyltransferase [Solirubrobacterales bacterium]
MTFEFEAIARDDPRVLALYREFIAEADGPLGIESGPDEAPPADLVPPNGILLLARVDGEPAGLGGIRHLDTGLAEVKSMYVAPGFRGIGLGRRILGELERIALERGCRGVRLDTSDYLTEAIGLYRSAGYSEVSDYNENPKASLWFERALRQDD